MDASCSRHRNANRYSVVKHKVTIAGRDIELEWTHESAKRFAFRIGDVGGEPTAKQFTNARTASTAVCKVLWALLPLSAFQRYSDPESLFVAIDHETESAAIFDAISAIYQERYPSEEKKSTLTKSPSLESNSD